MFVSPCPSKSSSFLSIQLVLAPPEAVRILTPVSGTNRETRHVTQQPANLFLLLRLLAALVHTNLQAHWNSTVLFLTGDAMN